MEGSDKQKACQHEWEKVRVQVLADNKHHDYKHQFYFIKKVCKMCADERTIDYIAAD